ncbi:hypothetical protein [Terriglobus sp. RCC_193]
MEAVGLYGVEVVLCDCDGVADGLAGGLVILCLNHAIGELR